MPKHFSILVVAIYLASNCCANDSLKGKTLISVNAGYTFNTVYGSMVKRNNDFGENVTMTNRGGFLVGVLFETPMQQSYLRYGIGYIQKQVNPMNGTYAIFKDTLNTGYISLPFLVGSNIFPTDRPVNIQVEAGPVANFRLIDNSSTGPDRVGFKTPFFTLSACAGASVSFLANNKMKLLLQYRYMVDMTNSYVETLWWSSQEPNKEFIYKYKTHAVSLGIQWPL